MVPGDPTHPEFYKSCKSRALEESGPRKQGFTHPLPLPATWRTVGGLWRQTKAEWRLGLESSGQNPTLHLLLTNSIWDKTVTLHGLSFLIHKGREETKLAAKVCCRARILISLFSGTTSTFVNFWNFFLNDQKYPLTSFPYSLLIFRKKPTNNH